MQALQEQFTEKDNYKISRYGTFKFKAAQDRELCIRVIPPCEHDQCVVALDPNPAEVRQSLPFINIILSMILSFIID